MQGIFLKFAGASYSLQPKRTIWKLKDNHRIEYPTSIFCQLKDDINVICHQCVDMLSGLLHLLKRHLKKYIWVSQKCRLLVRIILCYKQINCSSRIPECVEMTIMLFKRSV